MPHNLLILGGTTEASALARELAGAGISATVSLAGRVEKPRPLPLPTRIGGFGGAEGLAGYLREHDISRVIDATHPFAAAISRNAVTACAATGTPLLRLTRPAWREQAGDHWHEVTDIAGAVAALSRPAARVMLALGRMHLPEFAQNPQHFYLLRLVDPPAAPLPLPQAHVIVDRGPFEVQTDRALLREHGIDLIVSKNSGGTGAYAKIAAARALGLPVVMIARPEIPPATEVTSVSETMGWLHADTPRGV